MPQTVLKNKATPRKFLYVYNKVQDITKNCVEKLLNENKGTSIKTLSVVQDGVRFNCKQQISNSSNLSSNALFLKKIFCTRKNVYRTRTTYAITGKQNICTQYYRKTTSCFSIHALL